MRSTTWRGACEPPKRVSERSPRTTTRAGTRTSRLSKPSRNLRKIGIRVPSDSQSRERRIRVFFALSLPRARVSHSAVSASCLVSSVCPVCRAAGECVQRGLQTQVCRDLACYQQISSQPVTSSVRSLFYIITRVAHPTVSTPRQVSLWSVHTADSLSLQLSISPRARARAHTLWGVYTLRRSALGNTLLLSVLLHAHAP